MKTSTGSTGSVRYDYRQADARRYKLAWPSPIFSDAGSVTRFPRSSHEQPVQGVLATYQVRTGDVDAPCSRLAMTPHKYPLKFPFNMSASSKVSVTVESGAIAHVNFRVRCETLGHGDEVFLVQEGDTKRQKVCRKCLEFASQCSIESIV